MLLSFLHCSFVSGLDLLHGRIVLLRLLQYSAFLGGGEPGVSALGMIKSPASNDTDRDPFALCPQGVFQMIDPCLKPHTHHGSVLRCGLPLRSTAVHSAVISNGR